ncbi:MAG: MBL fold metallo-hydrolase [Steroidobacteraceae bacterium]
MPLPFALRWINLWLLDDGDGYVLIDSGLPDAPTRALWEQLLVGPMAGRRIKRLIVTHMHPDHVGLAGWLAERFSCPLLMSRLEYTTCRMLVGDSLRPAPAAAVEFYRRAGWDAPALEQYRTSFGEFGSNVAQLPESFQRLCEGDSLDIGGMPWRIVTGNGHSPEHACLWQETLGVLISGDQVLPRISSNVSVFPTEPEADPLSDWLRSCNRLAELIPADTLVLPAHNEPFVGVHARLEALVEGHERTMLRLLRRLSREECRAVDLFGAMFARSIGRELLHMATGETLAHLNCLMRRGAITRRPDSAGVYLYKSC